MMRKIWAFVILGALSACNSGGRVKDIVDFTPLIRPDVKAINKQVDMPKAELVSSWSDGVNFVNTQPQNIKLPITCHKHYSKKLVKSAGLIASPVIATGRIFTLDSRSVVHAYDIETLMHLWSYDISSEQDSKVYNTGGITYSGGDLFITNGTRDVVVLDADEGYEKFRTIMPDLVRTQVAADKNLVAAMTVSDEVHALNILTGDIAWSDVSGGKETYLTWKRKVAPMIINRTVYVPLNSGRVASFDAVNGQLKWLFKESNIRHDKYGSIPTDISAQPLISDDAMFFANGNDKLLAISLESGERLWQRDIADIISMNQIGGYIIITTNAKQVALVEKASGDIKWVLDLQSRSSKGLDKRPTSFTAPLVINGEIYVASTNGYLYKIDVNNGEIINEFAISKNVVAMIPSLEYLYLFTAQGEIISFK